MPALGHAQVQAGTAEDGDCSPPSGKWTMPSGRRPRSVHRAQFADEREQRQVHRNDHAADHHAQKHDHDGLEGGQQVFHRRVNFFFIEIGDLLKHGIHRAGLLADGDHLRDHAREHFGFLQRFGERLAFFERSPHLLQSPFDDRVAGSPGSNIQAFKDRHAAGDQRAEGSRKPRHGNLSHQEAKNGKFQDDGIEHKAPLRSAVPDLHSKNSGTESDQDEQTKNTADEIAQSNDDFRGKRKIYAKAGKQSGENRHDFPEQQGDNAARDGQDAYRVDQGGLDGALQLYVLFDVGREALQNGVQNTAGLARLDHVDVQGGKYLWRASHSRRGPRAAFDLATRVDQDFLEKLVLLLASENLETLHEWKTSVDHDGALAGAQRC